MPEKLEECVMRLMDDPDFKAEDGEDKEAAAYAVCTARLKNVDDKGVEEEAKETTENNQLIRRMFRFEATPLEGGSDWRVRIINAGTSKNRRTYPLTYFIEIKQFLKEFQFMQGVALITQCKNVALNLLLVSLKM